jgi:predicted permease
MGWMNRLRNLWRRREVAREIDEEMAVHLAMRAEDNRAAGMSESAAERDARIRFGSRAAVRERAAEADAALGLERFWADVRFALRQLRKSPGFAVAAVLALSLGIGASTAIFSVIETLLLRPLPFDHPERLVYPYMKGRSGGSMPSSVPSYLDERAQLTAFDAMAGYSTLDRINLEIPDASGSVTSVSLHAVKTTDNFFDVFAVKPILGRTFLPGEDLPGKDFVAVLSYEVWKTNFAGDAGIVGKVVRLDGSPYTIVGVMPPGFRFPLYSREAIYTPLHATGGWRTARGFHWLRTVGRMKAGVTLNEAQADISRVMANLGTAFPEQEANHTATLIPLAAEVNGFGSDHVRGMQGPVRMLTLAVLALLGIACVNVAGLLLARGVKREREMALRAAVGAGRKRLIRQLLNESLVLAAAGLAGGLLLGWLLLRFMNVFLVEAIARGADVRLDWVAAGVAAAAALVTSVVASLTPAFRLSGVDPNTALRAGGSGAGVNRAQHRLRSGFVVTQVALSLVLLLLSGLLLLNLRAMLATSLGFDAKHTLAVELSLSRGHYEQRDPIAAFYQPLLERVGRMPGVRGAGLIDVLPIAEWGNGYEIHITGQPPYPRNAAMGAETRYVSAGYFQAMGLALQAGRLLDPSTERPDVPSGKMVVNEAFRRKFFSAGGDPVGAHIDDNSAPEGKSQIVGMVSDLRQDIGSPPMPEMDWLMDAIPVDKRMESIRAMFLMVRTTGDPAEMVASIREAVRAVDPTVTMRPATMESVVSDQLILERMEGWLFGIFAGFALLLAVIGLYGLVSHEVELETRMIGIRMALGATRGAVLQRVLRRVAVLMLAGSATGWLLAVALRQVLASFVTMHGAGDLMLLAAVSAGLTIVGILTAIVPARAAASIDPMQALRTE